MATKRAISEFRDIKLYLTAAGANGTAAVLAPIKAFKALMSKVEQIESTYKTVGAFTDLSAAKVLCSGDTPYEIHVFTVTTTIATGVYLCIYVESVPNPAAVT